jgi:hypothetical protein
VSYFEEPSVTTRVSALVMPESDIDASFPGSATLRDSRLLCGGGPSADIDVSPTCLANPDEGRAPSKIALGNSSG